MQPCFGPNTSIIPVRASRVASRTCLRSSSWAICLAARSVASHPPVVSTSRRGRATSPANDVALDWNPVSEAKLLSSSTRRFPNRRAGRWIPHQLPTVVAPASPNRFSGTAALPINPKRPVQPSRPSRTSGVQVTDRCTRVVAWLPTCIPTNDRPGGHLFTPTLVLLDTVQCAFIWLMQTAISCWPDKTISLQEEPLDTYA